MPSLSADESVFPRRPVEQERDIHRRMSETRLTMIQGERLQPGAGLCRQPDCRKQQPSREPIETEDNESWKMLYFPNHRSLVFEFSTGMCEGFNAFHQTDRC